MHAQPIDHPFERELPVRHRDEPHRAVHELHVGRADLAEVAHGAIDLTRGFVAVVHFDELLDRIERAALVDARLVERRVENLLVHRGGELGRHDLGLVQERDDPLFVDPAQGHLRSHERLPPGRPQIALHLREPFAGVLGIPPERGREVAIEPIGDPAVKHVLRHVQVREVSRGERHLDLVAHRLRKRLPPGRPVAEVTERGERALALNIGRVAADAALDRAELPVEEEPSNVHVLLERGARGEFIGEGAGRIIAHKHFAEVRHAVAVDLPALDCVLDLVVFLADAGLDRHPAHKGFVELGRAFGQRRGIIEEDAHGVGPELDTWLEVLRHGLGAAPPRDRPL